jgi:hypothetical protein
VVWAAVVLVVKVVAVDGAVVVVDVVVIAGEGVDVATGVAAASVVVIGPGVMAVIQQQSNTVLTSTYSLYKENTVQCKTKKKLRGVHFLLSAMHILPGSCRVLFI